MNDLIRSPNLSALAKVIFLNIASHRQDYRLTMIQLVAQVKEGRDAVRRVIKDLESDGRLARVQVRDEHGVVTHFDFYIVDDPEAGPATDFQAVVATSGNAGSVQVAAGDWISGDGESGDGQPTPKKTISKKLTLEDQEDSPLPPAASSDQPRTAQYRNDGGRDAPQKENQEHAEAIGLVDQFIGDITAESITAVGRTRLVGATGAALGRGCTRNQVLSAFDQPLPHGEVHNLAGLMAGRMARLEAPYRPVPKPEWCGQCDTRTRLLWDDVAELSSRCPECHPLMAGAAA
jgi:hypothetical protein